MLSADETFIQSGFTKEAEMLLLQDVEKAERSVLRLIDVPLTDGQFDALCSLRNLGGGRCNDRRYAAVLIASTMTMFQRNSCAGSGWAQT